MSEIDTSNPPSIDWKSLIIKILLMVITPAAAQLHLNLGAGSLYAIAADLADLIVLGYGVYRSKGMKLVPHHALVVDPIITPANVGNANATVQTAAGNVVGKIVGTVLLAFVISAFLAGDPAMAQSAVKRVPATSANAVAASGQLLPLTGNGAADLANLLKRFTIAPAPTTSDEIQTTPCDFTIFSKLTVDNVIPLLEKCAQSVDQNVTAPLIADTQAALASAQAFGCGTPAPAACVGNGMAIACLVPALSLLKAAAGTPAVTDPATGKVTTPGVAAGVVTIGEKLDEFVQAGGPSNCKAVVQRTVNGLAAAALTP
jgi:hypothetical protein